MSRSTGTSSSGQYTGAPVARATGATAPMWSKWVWVTRIASIPSPSSSTTWRIRSSSSPGSTISPRSAAVAAQDEAVLGHLADGEHAHVHRRRGYRRNGRQPPCFFAARCGLELAQPAAVHEAVDVVADRHVHRQHHRREPAAAPTGAAEGEPEEQEEDPGAEQPALERAAPGRGDVAAVDHLALAAGLALGLGPRAGLLAVRGRPRGPRLSIRPVWVPRCLRRRLLRV